MALQSRLLTRCIWLFGLVVGLGILELGWPLAAHAQSPGPRQVFLPMIAGGSILPTSDTLIDQAQARGEIDAETALIYKTFAAFNDPRLPARFRGDDSELFDSPVLVEVDQRFDTLSPQTQALLAPFLLPPSAPGSWLELQGQSAATAHEKAAPEAITWDQKPAAGDKAWVWWQTRYSGDEALAKTLAGELTSTIWPRLTGVMGRREPLSDKDQSPNGIDGRIDFYLVRLGKDGRNGVERNWPKSCKRRPGYVLINSEKNSVRLQATLAHEFFHLLQDTYEPKYSCVSRTDFDLGWMVESTATWAVDYAYPCSQAEHGYAPDFLQFPERSLEDQRWGEYYGAYLWSFFLSHPKGFTDPCHPPGGINAADGSAIRRAWEATENAMSVDAFQQAIAGAGGFEKQWPEFTLRNWNQDPVTDYQDWDDLKEHVPNWSEIRVPGQLAGLPEVLVPLEQVDRIEHLSARYYHVTINDASVHGVTFYNGLTFKLSRKAITPLSTYDPYDTSFATLAWTDAQDATKKNAAIRAILKIDGSWQEPEDWTNEPYKTFCRDVPDENVEEMVIIISNSEWEDKLDKLQPEDLPPTLLYSNIPCDRWRVVANGASVGQGPGFPIGRWADATYTAQSADEYGIRKVRVASDADGARYLAGRRFPYLPGSGSIQAVINYDITYPEECTVRGTASREPTARDSAFLYINPFSLSGNGYRRYALSVALGVDANVTCRYTGSHVVLFVAPAAIAWWQDSSSPNECGDNSGKIFRVSPDGTKMKDIMATNCETYQWTITPVTTP